jgi:tubulin alpha
MEDLQCDFAKKFNMEFAVCPTQTSSSTVETYNSVLATHANLNHFDLTFMFDNAAIHHIFERKLRIERPTNTSVDSLIAQIVSSITASPRYGDDSLSDLATNLVPQPHMHFPLVAYAPNMPPGHVTFEEVSVANITSACFEHDNWMMDLGQENQKYMACYMLYQGNVQQSDVDRNIDTMMRNRNIQVVDWSPAWLKSSFNPQPPRVLPGSYLPTVPRAACLLASTAGMAEAWSRLNKCFCVAYGRKAFVHHYVGAGMQDTEFTKAKDAVSRLETDYINAGKDSDELEGEGAEEY